jgi:hypothetical protein
MASLGLLRYAPKVLEGELRVSKVFEGELRVYKVFDGGM